MAGAPIPGAFVLAYLAVWSLFARKEVAWPRAWMFAAIAAGAIAFSTMLIGSFGRMLESEQLTDLDAVLADRWRLTDLPAIAPPVLHADRPNVLYVHAEGRPVLRSGSNRDIELLDLGHGLFRADVEPEEIGAEVSIAIDGEVHRRELSIVRPSPHPRWIASEGRIACAVSKETDELFVIDGRLDRRQTSDRPTDCAVLDGAIFVIHETGEIATGTASIDLGAPLIHVSAGQEAIAVTRAEPRPSVVVLSQTLQIRSEIALPFEPDWIAIDQDDLIVSSARTRSIHAVRRGASLFLGRPAVTIAFDPERRLLYAAVTDYRPDGSAGPNHHIEEQILEIDARTLSIVRRIPTAPHASPIAIALTPERITIAYAGSDEVIRYDRSFAEMQRFEIDRPSGVAELGGDPIASSAANAKLGDQSLGDPDPLLRAGERAFLQATRAGPSCQTCHLHGGSDFSLHDIGHGDPRPTLDPRGKARTAPYLRGASYPSIAALEAFTTYVLGGYEAPIPDRAKALDAYLSSLAPPMAGGALPGVELLRKGNGAFVEAGCAFCHRYPAFTDLAQYPEGFLFPERKDELHLLDTPSLIGVADSAPYLYDGRAKTLEEVLFDHNRSGRHGRAASLSPDQRDALLAFLRSL